MLKADLKVNITKMKNLRKADLVGALTGDLSKRAVEIAKELSPIDTGKLQSGWKRQPIGAGRKGGYRIYNSVEYAVFVELGTYKRSAVPMLGPAMDQISDMIPDKAREIISAAVNGSASNSGGE